MRRIRAGATLVVFTSFGALGQWAPAFEVASIRLNKTGTRGGSMDFSRGGEKFTARNMPLGAFVLIAYNVTVRQLSGPGELLSEKYDISAKAEHAAGADEMLRMLQTLLVERFKLVVRREIRDAPVYALTIGKNGPKLRQSNPPGSPGAAPRTPSHAGGTEPRSGHLFFKSESMSDLAWALSRTAGLGDRVVVDHTGLKGTYDFELTLERDSVPPAGADLHEPTTPAEGRSIFSALQEQLGLKLESKRAPVEFLIVDHVERPNEN